MQIRTGAGVFSGLALLLMLPAAAFAASANVQGLTPGESVVVGNVVTFNMNTPGFTSPTFSAYDSFSGSSAGAGTMGSNGVFTWVPQTQDIGNHIFTVTVADGISTTTVQQKIFVNAPASADVQGFSSGTQVASGKNISFRIVANGFGAPAYAVTDSFVGSTLGTSTSVSNSGYFTWTPQPQDAGAHTLTVAVTDPQGHSANVTLALTVTTAPTVSLGGVGANASVAVNSPLNFTIAAYGLSSTSLSVTDSFVGSSIASSTIMGGAFSWTPTSHDLGAHTLVIKAIDEFGHSANTTLSVTVRAAGTPAPAAATPANTNKPASTNKTTKPALSVAQIQAILGLLQAFGADRSIIDNVSAALGSGVVLGAATERLASPLAVGSKGEEVVLLQQKLAAWGYFSGEATGYFGAQTALAVKAFQTAKGFEALGFVGPQTRAALNQ